MIDRFKVYEQPKRPEGREEEWLAGERVDARGKPNRLESMTFFSMANAHYYTDYILYGRLYLPTGRLDALYSTRISPTLQALVAVISDPPSSSSAPSRGGNLSNVMLSLQHDVGKWCTEYTWSAEDSMWGVRVLHNFGNLRGHNDSLTEDTDKNMPMAPGYNQGLKRVDEEDPVEGGLKGRVSAGAEFYFSAKERSAGG